MKRSNFGSEPQKAGRDRKDKLAGPVQRLMKEYKVQSKGKTLSGHFSPGGAIDVLQTAKSRGRSVSEILTEAVRFGLPEVKKQFPPIRPHAKTN